MLFLMPYIEEQKIYTIHDRLSNYWLVNVEDDGGEVFKFISEKGQDISSKEFYLEQFGIDYDYWVYTTPAIFQETGLAKNYHPLKEETLNSIQIYSLYFIEIFLLRIEYSILFCLICLCLLIFKSNYMLKNFIDN